MRLGMNWMNTIGGKAKTRSGIAGSITTVSYTHLDVYKRQGNARGQLGNGTTASSNLAGAVSGLEGVASISAGGNSTAAVKTDGTAWTWGANNRGQLGIGSNSDQYTPVKIQSIQDIEEIAIGNEHMLFLQTGGNVYACGENSYGQLGDGTQVQRTSPVLIDSVTNVTQIAAGNNCSAVVDSIKDLWSWGDNTYGQMGDNYTAEVSSPTSIPNPNGAIKNVRAGDDFTMILYQDGTVWTCGANDYGQLGFVDPESKNQLTKIPGLTNVTEIAAGGNFALARKNDGTVWAWGNNQYGQLGNGTNTNSGIPVQVSGLGNITKIDAGFQFGMALKSDGTVWTWGSNDNGQLGDGTFTNSNIPVRAGSLTGITTIAAASTHALAASSNQVFAWGNNSYYQLGDGSTTNSNLPVAIYNGNCYKLGGGYYYSAMQCSDSVYTWGTSFYYELGTSYWEHTTPYELDFMGYYLNGIFTGTTTVFYSTVSGVYAWGDTLYYLVPSSGPTVMPELGNTQEIDASNYHAVAFCSVYGGDDTILTWGRNYDGQLGAGGQSCYRRPRSINGNKLAPGDYDNADTLALGTTVADTLDSAFNDKWYTFTPETTGIYQGTIGSDVNTVVSLYELYDIWSDAPFISGTSYASGNKFQFEYCLQAGYQYYLRISPNYPGSSRDLDINISLKEAFSSRAEFSGNANDSFHVIAKLYKHMDISNTNLALSYNAQQIQPVTLVAGREETVLTPGTYGNVQIISVEPGKIVFKPVGITVPSGKYWSGFINAFKFKFNPDYTGSTVLTIGVQQ